jgi:hypothetical protein
MYEYTSTKYMHLRYIQYTFLLSFYRYSVRSVISGDASGHALPTLYGGILYVSTHIALLRRVE